MASFQLLLTFLAKEPRQITAIVPPDVVTLREAVKQHVAENHPLVTAVTQDKVVGWCGITPKQEPGYTHTGALGIGVLAEYRRTGIGDSMLKTALEKARQVQLTRIELEVFRSNVPALTFYIKNEFNIEGCKVNARMHQGIYDDILIMARFLA